jgi:hypothetical protein
MDGLLPAFTHESATLSLIRNAFAQQAPAAETR